MRNTLLIILLLWASSAMAQGIKPQMTAAQVTSTQAKIKKRLGAYPLMFESWRGESERKVRLEKVVITPAQNRIHLYFNEPLGQIGIREQTIERWEQMVRDTLGRDFATSRVQIYCKGTPIERLIPNLYRNRIAKDDSRHANPSKRTPWIRRVDSETFSKGLSGRNLAVWASHGRYYDHEKGDWIWQRPALFGAVEDLNSFEYTYRYLIPMLESAGAVVVSPRERDPNPREVIVDDAQAKVLSGTWRTQSGGFGAVSVIRSENPFEQGTYMATSTGGAVEYLVNAPLGEYALCVSYKTLPNSSVDVEYVVEHSGGVTHYIVNQQIGAGWVYLGTHVFDSKSKVTVNAKGVATTDAIRIGGGMGNVERGGRLSGFARWAEGARYFLQYSGVPSSIYARDSEDEKKSRDYYDDYKARGHWAAWLQNEKGVPLDAALTLHTNAGITDTLFGSLVLASTERNKGRFTNGTSKMASRDMADVILSQIISDLRIKHTPNWPRRAIYDKSYRETLAPDAPAVIIELLSHQNMNDMIYGLDPAFRFDACRAVYKGVLRFLAERYSVSYVVQPLAPVGFSMAVEQGRLKMSWKEQPDPLEPTARAGFYKLYTRINDGGFDNGVVVRGLSTDLPVIHDGRVRSYRVTALNDGGESFASEVLSCGFVPGSKRLALVVNEFIRTSAPDTVRGGLVFKNYVPYVHDLGIVGVQKNFDRRSVFVDTENPGWGRSSMEIATVGIAGNSFDYTMKKGASLMAEGYSYISTSLGGYDRGRRYDKVVSITGRL